MGSIVVCGGSMIGLCAGMMLAADGHEVIVLESDAEPVPSSPVEAWESWPRRGVAQFLQPHNLFARFRQICDDELPGLNDRLERAGCVWVDYLATPPPTLGPLKPGPDDERFRYLTGRRPVFEAAIAAAAEEQARLTVRRGVRVAGFLTGSPATEGVPHVTGVRTADGEELAADLVVDAMGRRTPSGTWLREIGAREPYVQAEDSGFLYYTRYFTGATRPERRGRALVAVGSFSLLTLDGDNDTWSVTLFAASGDPALKLLRHADRFTRVAAACPLHAHWLDGEPITDVLAMGGVIDKYRRFVVDGRPVATGFAAVGDAWACTNPSAGRGLSVGLVHAQLLRDVARETLDDPAALAERWDAATETYVAPFYWNQIAADRMRLAEMRALRDGLEPPIAAGPMAQLGLAAGYDEEAFRAALETILCLALPQEVLARPGIAETIARYDPADAPPIPGPSRQELLRLLDD